MGAMKAPFKHSSTLREKAERWLADFPKWQGPLAKSTVRTYEMEIAKYLLTCEEFKFSPWPVTAAKVIRHIDRLWLVTDEDGRPSSPSTTVKAVSALQRVVESKRHVQVGLEPVMSQVVKDRLATYEALYRGLEFYAHQAPPIPLEDLRAMVDGIDRRSWRGRRDACMVLLMLGMGCRVSELMGLSISPDRHVSDLREMDHLDRLPVFVRRAKNDKFGKGRICNVARVDADLDLCPVIAVEDYLEVSLHGNGYWEGPLFFRWKTKPDRFPRDTPRLGRNSMNRLLDRLAEPVGLADRGYSSHSLRRTAIQMMIRNGATLDAAARHVGHQQIETTRGYVGDEGYIHQSPMGEAMDAELNR